MNNPSIIVKNLVVTSRENSMHDGISFSLNQNEHLAIVGDAGSGKTILAKSIAGLVHFKGSITFNTKGITGKHTRIHFVEQRYTFKNLSGLNDFYYQQRFNSFDSSDAPSISEELYRLCAISRQTNNIDFVLGALEILPLKDSPLIQLSSGEHKRFQIAKALLNPAEILILDNPYTGLDTGSVKKLNNLLESISKKGTQLIIIPGTFPLPGFITHVACLQNNQLKFFGEKEKFESQKPIHSEEIKTFFDKELLPVYDDHRRYETIVEMKNVHLKYGQHTIIQSLDWTIAGGEKWLLKGRNGTGKSSLLSMITGDHPQAYSNEIYLFGKKRGSGESIWDIKQKTGYISPELHAYFDKNITCFDAIASGYFDTVGLFRKLNKIQNEKVHQWLEYLQLFHVSKKPLYSISTGLQRMILLARTLIKNPTLLVLDEPCQGLDEHQTLQFVSLIDHVCLNSDKTLIYVSHDERNIPHCIEKEFLLRKENYQIYINNHQHENAVA